MKLLLVILTLIWFSFAEVITSEGEGCSSDIKEAKKEALKNAKINAVEQHVGFLINTKTLVINGKLMRDIIHTRVMGVVKLVGEPQYSMPQLEGKDQICIKVRANFEIPESKIRPANFGLVLSLSKKELKPYEEFFIELYTQRSCYPYLFSVDAKERVYRLLPNPEQKTELLKGKMNFPTPKMMEAGYKLVAVPLQGLKFPQREEIVFVCSKEPIEAFEEFFPSAYAEDPKELRKLLRTPYKKTVERFNEILTQVGSENYDMVDDFYLVTN